MSQSLPAAPFALAARPTAAISESLGWRWLCLAAALIGELIWLSLRFDTGVFSNRPGATWWLLDHAPQLVRIAIASAAAFGLLAYERLPSLLIEACSNRCELSTAWRLWIAGHALSFVAFTLLADRLCPESGLSPLVLPACLVMAVSTGVTLCLAAMPWSSWQHLLWECRWAILGGLALGPCAWLAGEGIGQSWLPLTAGTLWLVKLQLVALYGNVVSDDALFIVGTEDFAVRISPQCSGCEGIGLTAVFLAAFLLLFRDRLRFPNALALLPLGVLAIWLLNAVRIAALIALGTSWSGDLALGGFHSQAGWLAFIGVAFTIMTSSLRWPWFARSSNHQWRLTLSPVAAYFGPFLAMLATSMIAAALVEDAAILALLPVLSAAAVLLLTRRYLPDLRNSFSILPIVTGLVVAIAWVLLLPLASRGSDVTGDKLAASSLGLACQLVSFVVVVPVVEELAFRGYLLPRLCAADFDRFSLAKASWMAVIVSSLLFGLLHSSHWIAGSLAGLAFALVAAGRGRLVDAMACHGTTNLTLACYAVITGDTRAWS